MIPLLLKLSYNLMRGVVNEVSQGYRITEEEKKFIADFYKYGYAGLIMDWVDNRMETDPHEIVAKLDYLIKGNFLEAVKRYADAANKGNKGRH